MFAASAFRKLSSIYVFSYFPFGFEGRIWDLIVSVPDHCLSFYLWPNTWKLSKLLISKFVACLSFIHVSLRRITSQELMNCIKAISQNFRLSPLMFHASMRSSSFWYYSLTSRKSPSSLPRTISLAPAPLTVLPRASSRSKAALKFLRFWSTDFVCWIPTPSLTFRRSAHLICAVVLTNSRSV